jgi:uncharacterized repeat protein (TIGR01451 family)
MFQWLKTRQRTAFVVTALASLGVWQEASAVGTLSGTTISNQASVNYSVGGVPQTFINSSPTGNSVAGASGGANTTFVVDNLVDLTVAEFGGVPTIATPGQNGVATRFTVTNTGNTAQGYQFILANVGGTVFGNIDSTDVSLISAAVDSNGNGVYDPGVDTAATIDTLAPDTSATVFIVANVPTTTLNGQFANVQLTARVAVAGTNGATLETETLGADTPGSVDVVFADAGGDATEAAVDQYAIQSAALTIAKTSAVAEDPINGTTDPKAIPGAFVEYAITITNTGAVAATGIAISDPMPANTTFRPAAYNGGAADVQITVGVGAPTFCVAEALADTNTDGCYRTATDLIVGSPAVSSVATGGAVAAVTVRFQVEIL